MRLYGTVWGNVGCVAVRDCGVSEGRIEMDSGRRHKAVCAVEEFGGECMAVWAKYGGMSNVYQCGAMYGSVGQCRAVWSIE